MKLGFLLKLLPRQLCLFGPGTRIQNAVQWIIKKKKKCPNCGSRQFGKNRLRCCRKGHWFCMNCRKCFITAVDCPVCYKRLPDEIKNKRVFPNG